MTARAPEHFSTARLIIRKPNLSDSPRLFDAYAKDPEVAHYMVWQPHTHIESFERWLDSTIKEFGTNGRSDYVVTRREDEDEPIGMISMRINKHSAEFGYVLQKSCWGFGYAPEALKSLVDWALSQSEIYRAWAFCHVANNRSARVMEKAGLTREALLRAWFVYPNLAPTPQDVLTYSKVRYA